MSGGSVYHLEPGAWARCRAYAQIVGERHLHAEHALRDRHDRVHRRDAVCKGAVAMGAVFGPEDPIGFDGLPEGVIAHGLYPRLNILDELKTLHDISVAKVGALMQIWKQKQ